MDYDIVIFIIVVIVMDNDMDMTQFSRVIVIEGANYLCLSLMGKCGVNRVKLASAFTW